MPRGRPKVKKPTLTPAQPLAGMPPRPPALGRVAAQKWGELIRVLAPSGLLTQADGDVLEQYCVAYETWRDSRAKLKAGKKSAVMTGRNGGDYPSPWVAIRNQAAAEMRILWEMLGLDPASRLKLPIDVGPKLHENPKDRFFHTRENA